MVIAQPAFPASDVWEITKKADWSKHTFSLEKAYFCAIFARLAYLHIPEFELRDEERVKVVPCLAYQTLVRQRSSSDVRQVLAASDFRQTFAIVTHYAVVVGVKTNDVVVVAIRGTKYLYDWLINLNARRFRLFDSRLVHRGFYGAIRFFVEDLLENLEPEVEKGVPIYLTGHSLGGAMAALLFATAFDRPYLWRRRNGLCNSCYTFGMPRYGSFGLMVDLRNPLHVINEGDIVPRVPPRWLGYSDCFSEYGVNGARAEREHRFDSLAFGTWIYRLITGAGVRAHQVELYVDQLAGGYATSIPPLNSGAAKTRRLTP